MTTNQENLEIQNIIDQLPQWTYLILSRYRLSRAEGKTHDQARDDVWDKLKKVGAVDQD